jgi:hypothetical protein
MVLFTSKSIVVNWLPSYYSFVLYVILLVSLHSLDAFPEAQKAPMDTQDEERPLIHHLPTQVLLLHLLEPYHIISCQSVNYNRDRLSYRLCECFFIGTLTNLDKASRC